MLSRRYGIETLCGSEVDILPDGSLDGDEEFLRELDIVIAFGSQRAATIARGDDGALDPRL